MSGKQRCKQLLLLHSDICETVSHSGRLVTHCVALTLVCSPGLTPVSMLILFFFFACVWALLSGIGWRGFTLFDTSLNFEGGQLDNAVRLVHWLSVY